MLESLPRSVEAVLAMSLTGFDPKTRAVTILTADASALPIFERAATAAGMRVSETAVPTGDALADAPFADVVLVDIRGLPSADVAARLGPINDHASAASQILVCASLDNLDDAIDACPDAADFLVGADELELHFLLAAALQRARSAATPWQDITNEEGLRLQRLADEIAHIARTLIDLPAGLTATSGMSERLRETGAVSQEDNGAIDQAEITAADVRAIIRLRRMRERFFSAELFADPAWDMLLDLSAARIERSRVAVSSLCIAAAVPPTTALRWIKAMTDRGLLRRVADPHDARRIFIQLSDDTALTMDRYLRAARANGGLTI